MEKTFSEQLQETKLIFTDNYYGLIAMIVGLLFFFSSWIIGVTTLFWYFFVGGIFGATFSEMFYLSKNKLVKEGKIQ